MSIQHIATLEATTTGIGTLTVSGIPNTGSHIWVLGSLRAEGADTTLDTFATITLNDKTTEQQYSSGIADSGGLTGDSSTTQMRWALSADYGDSKEFSLFEMFVPFYTDTSLHKLVYTNTAVDYTNGASLNWVQQGRIQTENTQVINKIDFTVASNFKPNSKLDVYIIVPD